MLRMWMFSEAFPLIQQFFYQKHGATGCLVGDLRDDGMKSYPCSTHEMGIPTKDANQSNIVEPYIIHLSTIGFCQK